MGIWTQPRSQLADYLCVYIINGATSDLWVESSEKRGRSGWMNWKKAPYLLGWHLCSEMWITFHHHPHPWQAARGTYSLNKHRLRPSRRRAQSPSPTLQRAAFIYKTSACIMQSLAVGLNSWPVQDQISVQLLPLHQILRRLAQDTNGHVLQITLKLMKWIYGYQFKKALALYLWLDYSH